MKNISTGIFFTPFDVEGVIFMKIKDDILEDGYRFNAIVVTGDEAYKPGDMFYFEKNVKIVDIWHPVWQGG